LTFFNNCNFRLGGGDDCYDEKRCCSPNLRAPNWSTTIADNKDIDVEIETLCQLYYQLCVECNHFGYPKSFPWNSRSGAHMYRARCPMNRTKIRRYHCKVCYAHHFCKLLTKATAQTGFWQHSDHTPLPREFIHRDLTRWEPVEQISWVAEKAKKTVDEDYYYY
jgi:hypothetical protein